jgi:uncharacterized RDD family membrane protein YckC
MQNKIIPLKIEGINDRIYSSFWSRLGANLLDMLIIIPFSILIIYLNSINLYLYLFTIIPNLIFMLWYNIYLPKKHGGTPGKLIVGLKIVKLNSSPFSWKESFLRHSVNLFFILANIIIMVIAIIKADSEIYNSLSWSEQSLYLSSIFNFGILTILMNIWIWGEIIVILFNKRRRAIHDFIAGTVIIKSKYLENIRNEMGE